MIIEHEANYLQTHFKYQNLKLKIVPFFPPKCNPLTPLTPLKIFSYVESFLLYELLIHSFSLKYNLFRQGHNINLLYKLEYVLHTFEKVHLILFSTLKTLFRQWFPSSFLWQLFLKTLTLIFLFSSVLPFSHKRNDTFLPHISALERLKLQLPK